MNDRTLELLTDTLKKEPYVCIRKQGTGFTVSGTPTKTLGHKVTSPDARPTEGIFASWNWDGHTFTAHVDECGFYPLYYYATDTECAVSPSIPALLLLGAPADLDHTALSVFLRLGWYLGADTPFKSIRAFLPGGTIAWSGGNLRVTGGSPVEKASGLNRSQGIDGYIDLFRASIRRRLPSSDDFTVLITGGRDSRHQLYELALAGRKPKKAYSIGEYIVASNDEMVAAAAVAQAVGVEHIIFNQTESAFDLEMRNNLMTNFCADEHSWLWPLADHLKGKYQTIYDGLGGSIYDRGFQLTEHRLALCDAGRFEDLADDLIVKEDVLCLLSPTIKAACPRDMAIQRIATELRIYKDTPNPIDSFLFWSRTRRESALSSYRVLDQSHTVVCPFIDLALVQHLASLPGSMMLDHNFHDDTIHRAFPQHAHIPFGPKGGPLSMKYSQACSLTLDLAQFLVSRQPCASISYGNLLPRMARCLVDPTYSISILWMGLYSFYMLQLDALPGQVQSLRKRA